ncbi:MAG: hypothetical protein MOB07_23230 [Acidobacteria bacterium]|nr:hypothetical protein [Acidobacteriota bacterium]
MLLTPLLKAKRLLRAVWSFVRWGDAPMIEHDRRMTICTDCDNLVYTPNGIFCGACDCPYSPVSDLRTKCRMRDVKCPVGKW